MPTTAPADIRVGGRARALLTTSVRGAAGRRRGEGCRGGPPPGRLVAPSPPLPRAGGVGSGAPPRMVTSSGPTAVRGAAI